MQTTSRPIALITGASSGIGLELARELAKRNHDLVLAARRIDRLEALSTELKRVYPEIACRTISVDLASSDGPHMLAERSVEALGRIDVLVNNAGFGLSAPLVDADAARTDELIRLNIGALTTLTRALLPAMIRRRSGAILNVASTAAFVPGPLMATYYASKAYVESFSVALRHECLHTGVRVSCLCPGPTKTEFSSVARAGKTKLFRHTRSMDPALVARIGVDGLDRNKAIVIPGFSNKIVAIGGLRLPRAMAAAIAAKLNRTT
jgi:short-subunit dehydrogenase